MAVAYIFLLTYYLHFWSHLLKHIYTLEITAAGERIEIFMNTSVESATGLNSEYIVQVKQTLSCEKVSSRENVS